VVREERDATGAIVALEFSSNPLLLFPVKGVPMTARQVTWSKKPRSLITVVTPDILAPGGDGGGAGTVTAAAATVLQSGVPVPVSSSAAGGSSGTAAATPSRGVKRAADTAATRARGETARRRLELRRLAMNPKLSMMHDL
jgi:hypothetical protein